MKISRTVLFILLFFISFSYTHADQKICQKDSEQYKIALDVKKAVINKNIEFLMTLVQPSGTYFIDDAYSRPEIYGLMKNKKSWLYKHLFIGNKSVYNYFREAEDLKIIVYERDLNAIFVSYQSSNFKSEDWVTCCFIRVDNKWYFDGIFVCE